MAILRIIVVDPQDLKQYLCDHKDEKGMVLVECGTHQSKSRDRVFYTRCYSIECEPLVRILRFLKTRRKVVKKGNFFTTSHIHMDWTTVEERLLTYPNLRIEVRIDIPEYY